MNAAYASFFKDKFPARACVGGQQIVFDFRVEISSTFLCPIRSPSRARNGTQSALTISCAASNQLTSASVMPRWSAMSLKIGV